jgi:hypothetical protein
VLISNGLFGSDYVRDFELPASEADATPRPAGKPQARPVKVLSVFSVLICGSISLSPSGIVSKKELKPWMNTNNTDKTVLNALSE